jgi:transcriptional antiterminator Rof (Rho-off)
VLFSQCGRLVLQLDVCCLICGTVQVALKDAQVAHAEKLETKARQLAARQNQEYLLKQMEEKLRRDFLDDTDMSQREKEFNKPILTHASATVKQPRHINIFD